MKYFQWFICGLILSGFSIQASADEKGDAKLKQQAFVEDVASNFLTNKKVVKNICDNKALDDDKFDKFLTNKLTERYSFKTEEKQSFVKKVRDHLNVTCKSYQTDAPTLVQTNDLITDAIQNALSVSQKAHKEAVKKEKQEPCACNDIESFEKDALTKVANQVLVKCHDKLYGKRTLWKDTPVEPICAARYGAVSYQLDHKRNEKNVVINKVLSFQPNAFDFHLNAGYAFTTVNNLWSSGNPRISLGMYRTFSGDQHTDPMDPDNYGWGLFSYGAHLATQIKLTDTGEEQNVSTKVPGVKIGNKRALEFESLLFMPAYMGKVSMYGQNRDYFFGPTALWSAKKIGNSTTTIDNKYMFTSHYFGFRATVGPESYTDVMIGRSEGVAGTRLMIRGQMPFNIPNTAQVIFLGLEGNLAIKNRKTNVSPETIRGYMTWRFDDLFDVFKASKKEEEKKDE